MVHALATGAEPVVFGDGEQTRDFVYVGDVAEAVTAACARAGLGLVNVASGTETTVSEIARLVARSIGVAREPRHTEPLAADVRRMVLDVFRAAAVLGWRATTPLAQGVRATVRAARTTTRAKEAS